MKHPYADLIGLQIDEMDKGHSRCSLIVSEKLMNPHGVVHGAAIYSLADSGMGAALYPSLEAGEICATIEIKLNYYRAVKDGQLSCITRVVNRGKSVANMESDIYCGDILVAKANGHYSIFTPSEKPI
ncbi:MAG: PaaI family thioesterase [Pseudomonadales bacterium]